MKGNSEQQADKYQGIFKLKPWDIHKIVNSINQRKVKVRSLLCHWAVREASMSLRELEGQLEMSRSGVRFAVEREEAFDMEGTSKVLWQTCQDIKEDLFCKNSVLKAKQVGDF